MEKIKEGNVYLLKLDNHNAYYRITNIIYDVVHYNYVAIKDDKIINVGTGRGKFDSIKIFFNNLIEEIPKITKIKEIDYFIEGSAIEDLRHPEIQSKFTVISKIKDDLVNPYYLDTLNIKTKYQYNWDTENFEEIKE